jgi:signal transduction histidine kinase
MMIKKLLWGSIQFMAYSLVVMTKAVLFIIAREIRLRKQAEAHTDELAQREAQRRMNEFLNIASHELKTPLTSIKGNLQLMGRRLKSGIEAQASSSVPNETNTSSTTTAVAYNTQDTNHLLVETRELLERTDKQVSHLTRLVNALLESSRLANSEMKLRLEPCEMNRLLSEVVQDAQYIHTKRTIHIERSEEDLVILADSQRVKQVVVHLLSNAHKFSPLEEKIDVVLQREDGKVRVSVHDSGPGIHPDDHNKVWERFYRIPGIEVQNGSEIGLGLGLYLSRSIIEQHNGTIGLKSAPGSGSTFWFILPLAERDEPVV